MFSQTRQREEEDDRRDLSFLIPCQPETADHRKACSRQLE